jgi:hypothetical protein
MAQCLPRAEDEYRELNDGPCAFKRRGLESLEHGACTAMSMLLTRTTAPN